MKHSVKGIRIRGEVATGTVDGKSFMAARYTDYKRGQRGAWKRRWRVYVVPLTKGETMAVVRALHDRKN